jgi:Ulp1 family protease
MSDDEEITKEKPKRIQSEAQKLAFKKCVEARKLKADTQKEVKVKEIVETKLVKLKEKEKKLLSKLPPPQPESEEEEEEEPEIVVVKRHKKPKKRIIVVEESESEDDIPIIQKVKKTVKPVKSATPQAAVVEPINNICFC